MDPALWAEIRRLHDRKGWPKKAIARHFGIDPKTVRRALAMEHYSPRKPPRRGSILDPFKPLIREILQKYPHLSAVRVREEIGASGYQGQITVVRDYLREIRPRFKEAFAKLQFRPGEAMQVDWTPVMTLPVDGTIRKVSAFLGTLCWSRLTYLEFTLSERLEILLECLKHAFEFFGGVPGEVWFDNPKTVVVARVGGAIRFHPRLLDFAAFYGFRPVACTPRRPNEKGIVESGCGYLKRNFLAGRTFRGFEDLRCQGIHWRDEVANRRIHRTTGRRPLEMFAEEKPHLLPLPAKPYDTRAVESVKATAQFRVLFEGNSYSVPPRFAGQVITLKASMTELWVYNGQEEVARHRRSYGRKKDIVDPAHLRELAELKRRVHRSALEERFRALGPEGAKYLEGLVAQRINAPSHMEKILRLADQYGQIEVLGALDRALQYGAFGFEYVQNILFERRRRRAQGPQLPLALPEHPDANLDCPPRDPAEYESPLEEDSHGEPT